MTVVDGFPVSPELVTALKFFSPTREHEETMLVCYVDYIGKVQDFLCRHMDQLPPNTHSEVMEYLSSLVNIKDDLRKLEKLLPIIPPAS